MRTARYALSKIKEEFNTSIDVFVGCGSFEERCLSVARAIDTTQVKYAIIGEDKSLHAYNSRNTDELRSLFPERTIDVSFDINDPIRSADSLVEALERIGERVNYLIDITTFTHEWLLILLFLLKKKPISMDRVTLIYASAKEYSIGEETGNKWLSIGVKEVRSILGYPGELLPSRPTHLIVLVGYEHERASKLIETYDPDKISLGHGRAGTETSPKHLDANLHFKRLVKKTAVLYAVVEDFEFSCSDPIDAKQAILLACGKTSGYNQVIAPMNTKLSTVGAALAAFEDDALQLCYTQPLRYNYQSYSSPGDACYIVRW